MRPENQVVIVGRDRHHHLTGREQRGGDDMQGIVVPVKVEYVHGEVEMGDYEDEVSQASTKFSPGVLNFWFP